MTWFCAQIGAREHYAIPRALHQAGRLAVLYTDFWAGPLTRSVWEQNRKLKLESRSGRGMGALRSLAARWHPELQNKAETLKAGGKPTPHPSPLPERSGEGVEQKVERRLFRGICGRCGGRF